MLKYPPPLIQPEKVLEVFVLIRHWVNLPSCHKHFGSFHWIIDCRTFNWILLFNDEFMGMMYGGIICFVQHYSKVWTAVNIDSTWKDIFIVHFVELWLADHRLGSPAGQESKAAIPAVNQRVDGCQQLRQRVHSTPANPVASLQALHPLCRAAGSLRRLRLLRLAWMKDELKRPGWEITTTLFRDVCPLQSLPGQVTNHHHLRITNPPTGK